MINNNLNVVTVLKLGGEYDERHVEWLQRQINKTIICLTDSKVPMEGVISIPLTHNFSGWWSKMEMFRPDIELGNIFLYTDLDTVFLNGVPEKYTQIKHNVVLSDMYGKPHMNSGLMILNRKTPVFKEIWNWFIDDPKMIMKNYKGDQDFLALFLQDSPKWQTLFPDEIVSYKADIRGNGFTGKEKIVVFHGIPRPWNASDKWIPKL